MSDGRFAGIEIEKYRSTWQGGGKMTDEPIKGCDMKYRKKPVVVEAALWTGNNHREMWDFLTGKPDQYIEARNI